MRLLLLISGLIFSQPAVSQMAADGESIPTGALQRLGSSRFRSEHLIQQAIYTPDGHTLIGCTRLEICLWDVQTGELRRKLSISDEVETRGRQGGPFRDGFALNPNGILLVCDGSNQGFRELQYWDLTTGTKVFSERTTRTARSMEWTPDGSKLIQTLSSGRESEPIQIRDRNGIVLPRKANWLTTAYNTRLRLIDNRRAIMFLAGEKPKIIDYETGETEVQLDIATEGRMLPQLAVSPGGKTIAFTCPEGAVIVDSSTGAILRTIKSKNGTSNLRSPPIFALDGKTLYLHDPQVTGIDVATGKEVLRLDFPNDASQNLAAISPDGKRICTFNRADHAVHQSDTATGKEIAQPPSHAFGLQALWLPDNLTIVARAKRERVWSVWNTASGERTRQFDLAYPKSAAWTGLAPVSLSANGRKLFDFNPEDSEGPVTAWDVASGCTESIVIPLAETVINQSTLLFQKHPQRVLSWDYEHREEGGTNNARRQFHLWNLHGNKVENTFFIDSKDGYDLEAHGPHLFHYSTRAVYGNDDEETDADKYSLRIYRIADGKQVRNLGLGDRLGHRVASTAKNELILTETRRYERTGYAVPQEPQKFMLWEFASAGKIGEWSLPPLTLPTAISPKADFIVQASDYRHFVIYDPYVTWKPLRTFEVPARIESFHFSPDGNRLLTVLADTTMVIWDSSHWGAEVKKTLAELDAGDFKELWNAMSLAPNRAYSAGRMLSVAGDRAVSLLREKIAPAKKFDEEKIQKWIAELDAPKFAIRERASKQLEEVGWWSEGLLQRAALTKPTLEVKSRLEKLLERIEQQHYDAETLRQLRAIRVLIWIDTPAAKSFLNELSKGDDHSPLTQAAKDAIAK